MLKLSVAVLLALDAGACDKQGLATPAPGSAAAASGAATPTKSAAGRDPWSEGSAAPRAASDACSDVEITSRMDESFAAIASYFGELDKRVRGWKDCQVASEGLLALEPAADAYVAEVMKTKSWGESLGPACRDRVKQLGSTHPEAKKIEARFAPLEASVKEVLDRCEDHPGFKEAASKGLRVMKKKKHAP